MPAHAALANEWRSLETRAQPSFFLTWSWIGAWLESLPSSVRPQLLRATAEGRTVGLAVIVDAPIRKFGLPLGRRAVLNATGQAALDGIAIEHNGFLAEADHASAVCERMVEFLVEPARPWRRVEMTRVDGGLPLVATTPRLSLHTDSQPCWVVDLQRAREHAGGYLGLLGSKTRWNVRRTRQACEEIAPLCIDEAADLDTARRYYAAMLHLHGLRWQDRGAGSAFDTPFAQRFHAVLMGQAFERGEVQLLRVRVGERDLGYLYNFVHGGRVSFYQSGFDYDLLGPRFSPGIATLSMAIEHNARLGHAVFDFLGGAVQYKQSLATHSEELQTLVFDRHDAAYHLEAWLRRHVRPVWHRVRDSSQQLRTWLKADPRAALQRLALAATLPLMAIALDGCV